MPRLRGRDDELGLLAERVADAVAGHGSVTVVEGVAGIGKSRLLAEAIAIAGRNGVRVATATARFPGETTPLGVLLRALTSGDAPLADAAALEAARGRPDERMWVRQELEAALEAAALRAPLLLVLDDLHWADAQSVAAVGALAGALDALPVAWLLALRPDEVVPAVRRTLDELAAERVRLAPIAPASVAEIVQDAVAAVPGPRLLAAAQATGGNAHALSELLAGTADEDLLTVADGVAELAPDALPARVRDHMRVRLARLSAPAREAVTGAAVLGRRSDAVALAALIGAGDLGAPLAEVADADLLAVDGTALAFHHDLVHAAVLETIPADERRALERRAVDVLLAFGASPAAVGARLVAVAEPGEAPATALLLAAARELGPTDPGAAADLARHGYALCAEDDPSRAALATETTVLLNASGRGEEGRAFAAAELDRLLSPDAQAEVLLSVAWMFSASPADQVAAAEQGLALAGVTHALRARLQSALVLSLGTAGRYDEAMAALPTALAAGAELTGADARFEQATAECFVLLATGRYTEMLAEVERNIALSADQPMHLWLWTHWRSDVLVLVDRLDEAMDVLVREVAQATRTGQAWDAQLYEQRRGRLLLLIGQTLEALAALEGLYEAGDGTDVSGPDATAIVALGRAALHAGDDGQTRVAAVLARRMLTAAVPEVRRQGALLTVLQALADEDAAGIAAGLDALVDDAGRLRMPTIIVDPAIGPYVARGALCVGDRAAADLVLAWQERHADANPGAVSIAGAVLHVRALLDGAPEAFAAAVDVLRTSPRPPLLASALEDLGAAHARAGNAEAAIAALDEAHERWTAAGASWDAGRVRRRLRRLGVRRGAAAGARAAGSAWERLTESEVAVARLVAAGHTNRAVAARLFVSPHTVGTHLRHTFAKLGIRSRVELVRLAAEHDAPADVRWEDLTPAETRVAERVAAGLSNAATAEQLAVSTSTVATHLRSVYAKLGLRTRTELARAATARAGSAASPRPGSR